MRSISPAEYAALQALPEIWPIVAQRFPSVLALDDPHHKPSLQLTYAELWEQLQQFAAGLQALGLNPGDRLCLFSDNSARWFLADQGCMTAGIVDVVRGAEADPQELAYIYENSGSSALIVEELKLYRKLQPLLPADEIKFVGLLSDETPPPDSPVQVVNFSGLMAIATQPFQPPNLQRDRLATLLYTSGTTGKPKGVMLSHGNLLHQINTFPAVIDPEPGNRILSILPTWHIFGRTVEYYMLAKGSTQIYTGIRHIKKDLQTYKPLYMASVPRLWESLYEGIQKQFREQPAKKQKLVDFFFGISQRYIQARRTAHRLDLDNLAPSVLERWSATVRSWIFWPFHRLGDRLVYQKVRDALGGEFRASISGGGALPMHLENFYEIVGLQLLVGYGLTETSPVLTVRRLERNLRRSAGLPLAQTEIKIVAPETRQTLPLGQKGLVMARGGQIMMGYYNNPEATKKAIDSDGWFDTGDLGWLTDKSDLVLTGREKDTIVLSNGENIEPEPLENACLRSPYIAQMIVVGQDQRSLGALIVPNLENLAQYVASQGKSLQLPELVALETPSASGEPIPLDAPEIQELFRKELIREIQNRPGYRPDDRIGAFRLIAEPFSIENGLLTQKMSMRRPVVMERYRDMIDGMFR
jgi:long-chain acyl-CoA synthetase